MYIYVKSALKGEPARAEVVQGSINQEDLVNSQNISFCSGECTWLVLIVYYFTIL